MSIPTNFELRWLFCDDLLCFSPIISHEEYGQSFSSDRVKVDNNKYVILGWFPLWLHCDLIALYSYLQKDSEDDC